MLGSAEHTAYDLRFRAVGVPVRVHPLFWLVMLILSHMVDVDLKRAFVFVVCAFISILVHEFGHGLSGRLMGDEPSEIVLYAMGGYCAFHQGHLTRWRRLFMLFAGPGAGFLLFGLVFAFDQNLETMPGGLTRLAIHDLLEINLFWGLLNLMPLWPLDGGQITGVGLGMISPRSGMRWTHTIGLLTAGAIAVWQASEQYLMAIWFGYFAYINYHMLQTMHYAYSAPDESEWWRR